MWRHTVNMNVCGSGTGSGNVGHRAWVESHVPGDAVADDECALLATAGNAYSTRVMQWLVVLEPFHRRLGDAREGTLHANVIACLYGRLLKAFCEHWRFSVK